MKLVYVAYEQIYINKEVKKMIFWIILVVLVGGIVWYLIDNFSDIAIILMVVGGTFAFIAISFIGIFQIGANSELLSLKTQQAAIEYKIDSGLYKDDINALDIDVVTEVKEWNGELIRMQTLQDDFWVGIFIPNIYDELEIIDYTRIK